MQETQTDGGECVQFTAEGACLDDDGQFGAGRVRGVGAEEGPQLKVNNGGVRDGEGGADPGRPIEGE